MHTDLKVGEVWFAELGRVEKSRSVLVLEVPGDHDARALVVVAPPPNRRRTTQSQTPTHFSAKSGIKVGGSPLRSSSSRVRRHRERGPDGSQTVPVWIISNPVRHALATS